MSSVMDLKLDTGTDQFKPLLFVTLSVVLLLAPGTGATRENDHKCPEGQVYYKGAGGCIDCSVCIPDQPKTCPVGCEERPSKCPQDHYYFLEECMACNETCRSISKDKCPSDCEGWETRAVRLEKAEGRPELSDSVLEKDSSRSSQNYALPLPIGIVIGIALSVCILIVAGVAFVVWVVSLKWEKHRGQQDDEERGLDGDSQNSATGEGPQQFDNPHRVERIEQDGQNPADPNEGEEGREDEALLRGQEQENLGDGKPMHQVQDDEPKNCVVP